jgi:hypothetical protein
MELRERAQSSPVWEVLSEECRRQVVELLVQLFRSEAVHDEEDGDE